MPTLAPIPVSIAVLRWARTESGYALVEVANKVGVKTERLEAWERGERQPTMYQIEKLAHVYRRPLGLFFQPAPPALEPLAAEYRRLSGVVPGNGSPEFRFAVRRMLEIRDRTLE